MIKKNDQTKDPTYPVTYEDLLIVSVLYQLKSKSISCNSFSQAKQHLKAFVWGSYNFLAKCLN